jgi:hypothetical protein
MRALFACSMFIIAGLTVGTLAPTAVAAAPRAASPAPRAASPAPRAIGVPAGARVQPGHVPKASASAPLADRPRPGKNAPTTLGGPAKYDAKKGAMLGGSVMPHRQ